MLPIEIEFVCANSDYPHLKSILEKHVLLMDKFSNKKNMYPYRQDFSNGDNIETSFAVIVTTNVAKKYVINEAKKVGLRIDIIDYTTESHLEDVINRKMEGQL